MITFDEYCEHVAHNINGPTTIAVAHADRGIGDFVASLGNGSGYEPLRLINFAFSTWRSAAIFAKAGTFAQTPSMLRLCVEAVWYAHLLKYDEKWHEIWKRGSKTAKNQISKSAQTAAKALMAAKQPELHSAMNSFYNEMIAIGGHPNPDAIDLMTILDFKEGEENGMVYLTQLGDEAQRHLSEMNVLRTAQMIVKSFGAIWPERYLLLGYEKNYKSMCESILTYVRINDTTEHRRYLPAPK